MDILSYFGWTYISMLYSDDSYGLNAANQMDSQAKQRGVCIAVEYRLTSSDNEASLRKLIARLVAYRDAKVIVIFAQNSPTDLLLKLMHDLDIINKFLFLSGDWVRAYTPQASYPQLLNGTYKRNLFAFCQRLHYFNTCKTFYIFCV